MKTRKLRYSRSSDAQNAMLDKAVEDMNEMIEHFIFNGSNGEVNSLKFTLKADAGEGKNVEINLNEKIFIETEDYANVSALKIEMKKQLCDIISAMCNFTDFDFTDFESDDYE